MIFDIYDLLLFETIERTGSFARAAAQLYRTRSAITQHVKKIEDQLGFQLYDRTSYRPTLTPEGKLFLERGRPLLRHFERIRAEVKQIKEGWESEFAIVLDDVLEHENIFFLLEDFRKVAPGVTVRLGREVLNGCWEALKEERAILVIGATGEPPEDLICGQQSLGIIEFTFVVAQSHPLASLPQPLDPEIVEAFPSIIVSDTASTMRKRSVPLNSRQPKIIVPTMDAKIQAQVLGLGVGNLPRSRIQSLLDQGKLVEVEIAGQGKRQAHIKIAWKAHSQSPSLAWFLEAFQSPDVLNRLMGNI